MVRSIFLFFVLFSFACIVDGRSIAPISDITQNFVYKGQLSTKRVITAPCTSAFDRGVLNGGNFEVKIRCNAPVYSYPIITVSTVPAVTIQGRSKACEVPSLIAAINSNPDYANATVNSAGVKVYQTQKTTLPSNANSIRMHPTFFKRVRMETRSVHDVPGTRTKPLVGEILAAGALTLASLAYAEVQQVKKDVSALKEKTAGMETIMTGNSLQIQKLLQRDAAITNSLDQQVGINNKTFELLNATQYEINRIGSAFNETVAAFNLTSKQTTAAFNKTITETKEAFRKFQVEIADDINVANSMINYTLKALIDLTDIVNKDRYQSSLSSHMADRRSLGVMSFLFDTIRQVGLKRLLTRGLFDSLDIMPEDGFHLHYDPGVRYSDEVLSGPYSRILIDETFINYIPNTGVGSREAFVTTFRWYEESIYAIDNTRPFSSSFDITSSHGPLMCRRPYADSFVEADSIDNMNPNSTPLCQLWIEEKTESCTVNSNFDWKTSTSKVVLSTDFCTSNPAPQKQKVYRSRASFDERVAEIYLSPLKSDARYFIYSSGRRQTSFEVLPPQRTEDAYLSYQVAAHTLDYATMALRIATDITLAFSTNDYRSSFLSDVANVEQIIYGRGFGGTVEYELPTDFVPTRRVPSSDPAFADNPDYDTIIPNGNANPSRCMFSEYSWVSRTAIPMQAAVPQDFEPVTASVSIETITGIGSEDPAMVVTKEDVQEFLQFTADASHLVPESILFLGDTNATSGIVWDVPPGLLCSSSDDRSCEKKIGWYSGFANETTTPKLPVWTARNPNRYDPRKMGPNPGIYARPVVRDEEGYPRCVVSGGISQQDLVRGTTNQPANFPNCEGAFEWIDTKFPSQLAVPCNGFSDPGVYWYKDNAIRTSSVPTSVDLIADWSLSFTYYTTASVPTLTILDLMTSASVHLQITAGSAITITAGNLPPYVIPVHHHTHGAIHTVWISWKLVGGVLSVYSDFTLLAKEESFFYGAQSGSPPSAVQIFDLNRTPGAGARIYSMVYYNTVHAPNTMLRLSTCHASMAPFKRCDVVSTDPKTAHPLDSTNGFNIFRKTLLAYQVPVSGCYVGTSVLLSDTSTLPLLNFDANAPDWALTFWTDHKTISGIFTRLVDFGTEIGIAIEISTARLRIIRHSNSQSPINGDLFAEKGVSVDSALSHFYAIRKSGINLVISIDTANVLTTTTTVVPFAFDALNLRNHLAFASQVTMGRWYLSGLNVTGVSYARACDTSVAGSSTEYRTPLSVCIVDATNPTSGYCRHPSMCVGGRCSAYTRDLDSKAGTYTVSRIQCDPGYKGDKCQTSCVGHVDQGGYCLDTNTAPFGNVTYPFKGSIPDGRWCEILKHFRVWEETDNAGNRVLKLSPREWKMLFTATIPQGNFVTQIAEGVCPSVELSAIGNTTIVGKLKNTGNVDTEIRITWNNTGSQLGYPADARCASQFSSHVDYVVPALFTREFLSPPCNNTNIQISLRTGADTFTPCGPPISHTYFPQLIQKAQEYPDIAVTVTELATSQLTLQLNRVSLDSMLKQLQIDYATQVAIGASTDLIKGLEGQIAYLKNYTVTNKPFNIDDLFTQGPVIGGETFDEILARISSSATQLSLFNISKDLAIARAKNEEIVSNIAFIRTSINESQEILDEMNDILARIKNITYSSGGGASFLDVLNAAANGAAKAADKAVSIATGGIDRVAGLFDSIFGAGSGISNFFTGLFGTILHILFICLLVYAAYLAYQWYSKRQEKKELEDSIKLQAQSNAVKYRSDESRPLVSKGLTKRSLP